MAAAFFKTAGLLTLGLMNSNILRPNFSSNNAQSDIQSQSQTYKAPNDKARTEKTICPFGTTPINRECQYTVTKVPPGPYSRNYAHQVAVPSTRKFDPNDYLTWRITDFSDHKNWGNIEEHWGKLDEPYGTEAYRPPITEGAFLYMNYLKKMQPTIDLVEETYPEFLPECIHAAKRIAARLENSRTENTHKRSTYFDISIALLAFSIVGGGIGVTIKKKNKKVYKTMETETEPPQAKEFGTKATETEKKVLVSFGTEPELTRVFENSTSTQMTGQDISDLENSKNELEQTIERLLGDIQTLQGEKAILSLSNLEHSRTHIQDQGIIREKGVEISGLQRENLEKDRLVDVLYATIATKQAELNQVRHELERKNQEVEELLEAFTERVNLISQLRLELFNVHDTNDNEKDRLNNEILFLHDLLDIKDVEIRELSRFINNGVDNQVRNIEREVQQQANILRGNIIDIEQVVKTFYTRSFETIDLVYQIMDFIIRKEYDDEDYNKDNAYTLIKLNSIDSERYRLIQKDSFSIVVDGLNNNIEIPNQLGEKTLRIMTQLENFLVWSARNQRKSFTYILLLHLLCIAYYTKLHLSRDTLGDIQNIRVVREWQYQNALPNPDFILAKALVRRICGKEFTTQSDQYRHCQTILENIENLL